MLEKIICFLQGKVAPIGLIITLIMSFILTEVEVKYYDFNSQEVTILFFMFTFLFFIFIFLIVMKIYELSQEKIEPKQFTEQEENNE